MKRNSLCFLLVSWMLLFAVESAAQKSKSQKTKKTTTQKTTPVKSKQKTTSAPVKKTTTQKNEAKAADNTKPVNVTTGDPAQDEQKVKDIIAFLEFMLNTLGSSATSARDKDVMVNESYSKIFRDAKVQIEDDLDEEREVITNKDVVAYLKDVDFFFKEVKFTFNIEGIQRSTMPDGHLFYKVSLRRILTGTTADGNAINNTQPRFAEINYNPDDQDLKIVSLYTNIINEKEALTNWWKELSYEWQAVFKRKLTLIDSVSFSDIKTITGIEDLDLSNNNYIQNIDPLSQLSNLKLLNLSHTQVSDLTPIRNLSDLVELDVSSTKIFDLTPLQYCNKLQRLNISNTDVRSVVTLQKLTAIQNLQMSTTDVFDFTPLTSLTGLLNLDLKGNQVTELKWITPLRQLVTLNASSTPIEDITPLKEIKALQTLTIDSTRIRDLAPLTSLDQLKVLNINYTLVSDLQSLSKLPRLEKIYCDQAAIPREKADAFRSAHPQILVVYATKELSAWWGKLDPEWKKNLGNLVKIQDTPTKEQLALITGIDSITLSGNTYIRDIEPLRKLPNLKTLRIDKTQVKDLSPLQGHTSLQLLDISGTEASDLTPLSQSLKLTEIRADNSKVENIEALSGMKVLGKVYVDHTNIQDINAREFLAKNPKCLLIYKTVHLDRWWSSLSPEWKDVLRSQMEKDTTSSRENLHRLVERESLKFKDASVNDLSALSEFVHLRELQFSGTGIHNIPAMENILSLKILHATSSPISDIGSLSQFTALEDLDLSNTPVDELKPLGALQNLKTLNCSGTQIKKLDPLERLHELEFLDCSNTRAGSLDPLEHLSLKTLKCYNTKVSGKDVEKFKKKHPDANVVFYR